MRKITILACLLMLCSMSGCHSLLPLRKPEQPSGPHFTIMTYNIGWTGPTPGRTRETIERIDADIICLQETTSEWEKYFRAKFGSRYPYARFQFTPGRPAGGLGILSRYPISQVAEVTNHIGWYNGWVVESSTPVGKVQILIVHLKPAIDETGETSPGGVLVPANIHQQEISRFQQYTQSDIPTIVAGCFNEDNNEQGSALRWLKDHGLTDALAEFDRQSPTWYWQSGGLKTQRRLDYIFYSPELYCFQARVADTGGSDHRPVIAVFGKPASS